MVSYTRAATSIPAAGATQYSQWVYQPATSNGVPFEREIKIEVTFRP